MSTQLFLLGDGTDITNPWVWGRTIQLQNAAGSNVGMAGRRLGTSRGGGAQGITLNTVAGPTSGVDVGSVSSAPHRYITPPVDQDVTISGSITFNIWGSESSMNANVAINVAITKITRTGGAVDAVHTTSRVTELGTSNAANNWSETPSSFSLQKGDRLCIRMWGDDSSGANMASGFTFTVRHNGTTAAADGDSYIQFTETFGFLTTDPTTQQMWMNDIASDVSQGNNEKEVWTTPHGNSATTSVTNTAAGPTAGIQCTDTAGGTTLDWYTRPLQANTLTGPVLVQIRASESATATRASIKAAIYIVNQDGSGLTAWGAWAAGIAGTTEATYTFYVAGGDQSISDGQRIMIRLSVDDNFSDSSALVTGRTITVNYSGTGTPTAECTVWFNQTFAEFTPPPAIDYPRRRMSSYLPH